MPRWAANVAGALLALATVCIANAAPPISATARKEADALYQTAYSTYVAGDYNRSLGLLDSAEALRPDNADCLNLRGIICLRLSQYDKAEAAFSRAVALDPTLWAAQFNLGEIPFRKKDFAVARERFDKLLSRTNRFKERNQWELVEYKAYLASLLTNDPDAQKRLDRLTPTGGVTPAYQYAEAALALSKKDTAAASRWLTIAQASYSPALNNLFADSLTTAGWGPSLPAATALALARQGGANLGAPRDRPASAYLDTRLEAAAAEPLPAADGGILPMLPQSPRFGPRPDFSLLPERQAPIAASPDFQAAPAPTPMSGLDNGGLLLSN